MMNSYSENEIKTTLFRLNHLPYVARIHAIRLMQHREQIKLALSSKKMEHYVKQARLKINMYTINAVGSYSYISLEGNQVILQRNLSETYPEDSAYIAEKHLEPWLNNTDSWTSGVYQHLQNILPCNTLELVIDASDLAGTTIKEILETPIFQNFEVLYLQGEELKAEDLDLAMETMHDNRDIDVSGYFPPDYTHENAFKFYDIRYEDACWVRLEHLYTLKDRYQVRLEYNTFTCADMNNLIKYWVNCEHDMFQVFKIYENDEMQLTMEKLAKGLVVMKFANLYVVSAKNDKNRKFPILSIYISEGELTLAAFPIEDNHDIKHKPYYEVYYKHLHFFLEKLNKRKALEEELEALDTTVPATEEERVELGKRSTEVQKKLARHKKWWDDYFDFEGEITAMLV